MMKVCAKFASVKVDNHIYMFRHHTILQNTDEPGPAVALVYMLNPGSSRPVSNELFNELQSGPMSTDGVVEATGDPTMGRVSTLVETAFKVNGCPLPSSYCIHIENLFNLREENNQEAKRIFRSWKTADLPGDPMTIARKLEASYPLVWFAWGKTSIRKELQNKLKIRFPNSIYVNKLNSRGKIIQTDYPVHPLYMNSEYFAETAIGKVRQDEIS